MPFSFAVTASLYCLLVLGPSGRMVSVQGVVLDEATNQPVAGVRVLVRGDWRDQLGSDSLKEERLVMSDEEGRFSAQFKTDFPVWHLGILAWDDKFQRHGRVGREWWGQNMELWLRRGGKRTTTSVTRTAFFPPGQGVHTVILEKQTPEQQARWQKYSDLGILW